MQSAEADVAAPWSIFRPERRTLALGMAVNCLMAKATFHRMSFGELSQILAGLINRDHYFFVLDGGKVVVGFAGWAETGREAAERWLAGGRPPNFAECRAGGCLLVNVWTADSPSVNRFMVSEMRKLHRDKDAMYFKRYYPDGKNRPVRKRPQ